MATKTSQSPMLPEIVMTFMLIMITRGYSFSHTLCVFMFYVYLEFTFNRLISVFHLNWPYILKVLFILPYFLAEWPFSVNSSQYPNLCFHFCLWYCQNPHSLFLQFILVYTNLHSKDNLSFPQLVSNLQKLLDAVLVMIVGVTNQLPSTKKL